KAVFILTGDLKENQLHGKSEENPRADFAVLGFESSIPKRFTDRNLDFSRDALNADTGIGIKKEAQFLGSDNVQRHRLGLCKKHFRAAVAHACCDGRKCEISFQEGPLHVSTEDLEFID